MKIKLCFPPEGLKAVHALGLRQITPETLRLVMDHPSNPTGAAVLLRGKSGEILTSESFLTLVKNFGVWIKVDSEQTKNRVAKALGCDPQVVTEKIKVSTDADDHKQSGQSAFFKAMEEVSASDGWKVEFDPEIPFMELGEYSSRIYLIDSSTGWSSGGSIKPKSFSKISELYQRSGIDSNLIADMVGRKVLELGERNAASNDPELNHALQLAAAAFVGTKTFSLAKEKTLSGHWVYVTYKLRDESVLIRPFYFSKDGPGFVDPEMLMAIASECVAGDLNTPNSTVNKNIKSGGGAILAPYFQELQ